MAIFTGTTGNDSITGTAGGDDFHLEQGGEDTAIGGGGKDVFYMGGAMTAADHIDGGAGGDVLDLDGDYSAGLVFAASTMAGMETILLTAGHDYRISGLTDANFGNKANVLGGTLGADDSLYVNARAVTTNMHLLGGAGDDTLIGGSGQNILDSGEGEDKLIGGALSNQFFLGSGRDVARGGAGGDSFEINDGVDLNPLDKLNGKGGDNEIVFYGDHDPLVLRDHTFQNVARMYIDQVTGQFDLTMADGNVAAGETLNIIFQTNQGGHFHFDGSAETDGRFIISGGDQTNVLIGGGGDDELHAGFNGSTLEGGLGADKLFTDGEHDLLIYAGVADSTAAAPDVIDFLDQCTIDVHAIDADTTTAGNQDFHLVGSFTGHAGELVVHYDNARHTTTIAGDVDGDGVGDLVIIADGNHAGFDSFVL